ncbi:MAG: hypothetical protein ACM358_04935 [Gemmatimonadota bacterium]
MKAEIGIDESGAMFLVITPKNRTEMSMLTHAAPSLGLVVSDIDCQAKLYPAGVEVECTDCAFFKKLHGWTCRAHTRPADRIERAKAIGVVR